MGLARVRRLIPDRPKYERAVFSGDGIVTIFEVMRPIVAGSYTVHLGSELQVEAVDYVADLDVGTFAMTTAPDAAVAVYIAYQHTYLSDTDIMDLLTLEGDVDKLAAADALGIIAADEVLIQKVIKVMDLQTQGDRVAAALLKRADMLKAEVEGEPAFAFAEVPMDDFALREEYWRDAAE